MKTVAQQTELPDDVNKLLHCDKFYQRVTNEAERLAPVCFFIDFAQRADATLAETYDQWLSLKTINGWKKKWDKRDKMVADTTTLVAYSLDHRYRGKNLTQRQKQIVDHFLLKTLKSSSCHQDLIDFREKRGIFSNEKMQALSPDGFWRFLLSTHKLLAETALRFVTLPASSACLERLFSMWGKIHNNERNRLGPERSFKSATIYHYLRKEA